MEYFIVDIKQLKYIELWNIIYEGGSVISLRLGEYKTVNHVLEKCKLSNLHFCKKK